MNLLTLLNLLDSGGSALANTPEFARLFNSATDALRTRDQQIARGALADTQAGTEEGRARLLATIAALQ